MNPEQARQTIGETFRQEFDDARLLYFIRNLVADYLNITGLQVALLLNFKEAKLDWKRVVNERRISTADGADKE